MKNSHANLLEASYNISDKDWRIIRSMLRVLLRQSDTVRKSENVANAIQNIARDEDRIVFFKYFIKGQSILNVSMDQYFSVESVKRYLKRGTKDFIAVYNNGALAKLFIE